MVKDIATFTLRHFYEGRLMKWSVCLCTISMTTAAIPVDESFSSWTIWNYIALYKVYISFKTAWLVRSTEKSHCPKYIYIYIYIYILIILLLVRGLIILFHSCAGWWRVVPASPVELTTLLIKASQAWWSCKSLLKIFTQPYLFIKHAAVVNQF